MPRFFTDRNLSAENQGATLCVDGENGRHISKSLRMRPGENITLCDGMGTDCLCRITQVDGETVWVEVISREASSSEPTTCVRLYQGLPKSDKMELVIQKSTELGVSAVIPVETEFCVAKISGKEEKKLARWQKIALEASKQSGRGRICTIEPPVSFKEALRTAPGKKIFLYEKGGEPLRKIINEDDTQVSIFVGPEGGFSKEEAELAESMGAFTATLGPRILRTETAPLAALAVIMCETGNLD